MFESLGVFWKHNKNQMPLSNKFIALLNTIHFKFLLQNILSKFSYFFFIKILDNFYNNKIILIIDSKVKKKKTLLYNHKIEK